MFNLEIANVVVDFGGGGAVIFRHRCGGRFGFGLEPGSFLLEPAGEHRVHV
jgi:hypothetical protein